MINISGICEVRFLPISDTSALGNKFEPHISFPFVSGLFMILSGCECMHVSYHEAVMK